MYEALIHSLESMLIAAELYVLEHVHVCSYPPPYFILFLRRSAFEASLPSHSKCLWPTTSVAACSHGDWE